MACEPVDLPSPADIYSEDVDEQVLALDALKAPILQAWPERSGCIAVRARRDRILELAMGIGAEDPRGLTIRYLAMQCSLPRVMAELSDSARREWPAFSSYQLHCMEGGAGSDPRCLAAIASVVRCEAVSGCLDRPLCSPVCGW